MGKKSGTALIRTIVLISLFAAGCAPKQTHIVVYSQTSLAGSTGSTPGLYDQLGLTGGPSPRPDAFQIFENDSGKDVYITRASFYGAVQTDSTVLIVPVLHGTANGIAELLIPDTNPAHALAAVTLKAGPTEPGRIDITFSPAVALPAGGLLALGVKVPLEKPVDVTLFGTDVLEGRLISTTPPYWSSFYYTDSVGVIGLGCGNHYLVIEAVTGYGR